MRIYFNLFISTILIIPISSFGQNINSYNIDAKLNSEDKTIEIYQVMKFKNTSNILLKEIYLEDWSNSYIDNTTKLAKRISDEYSRSFSFAQKKQRGSTLINNIKSNDIETWERSNNSSDIIKVNLKKPISKDESIEIAEHKSKKILCLMFHPERNMKSDKLLVEAIRIFFK